MAKAGFMAPLNRNFRLSLFSISFVFGGDFII